VQNFRQSLLLRPGYATALLNLGNVYRRQEDFEKAGTALPVPLRYNRMIRRRTTVWACFTHNRTN